MMLVVVLVSVMLYEVFVRYVLEAPTLWANELSLWIAGYIFMGAGLYAMQQRSHIRIFLLYDICPRWLQRTFDTISTVLILVFAFALVYGGYGEALDKMFRWETFGTAFDPPIPAFLFLQIIMGISSSPPNIGRKPSMIAPVISMKAEHFMFAMEIISAGSVGLSVCC